MSDADLFRIPVGAGTLHVERFGFGGPPVLLVHGFAGSTFSWRHVGPLIASRKGTAFAIDLLGYGESDRPFGANYGATAQAGYLDLALTALRVSKATVVGVDIGAVIALWLAFDRPARVDRLVLVSPPVLRGFPPNETRDLQRGSARYALALNRGLLSAMPLFQEFVSAQFGQPERAVPHLIGRYLAPFLGRDGLTHLQTLARSLVEEEIDELMPEEISQPTLIVRGTRDQFCDRKGAEALAKQMPSAGFAELDGVGRLVAEEAPDRLAELILPSIVVPDGDDPVERVGAVGGR